MIVAHPEVTAVVVNWNTQDLLDRCLASLRDHADLAVGSTLQVIVVDNGSTDGSADLVRDAWPQVELIANDENVGYTRANNQALALARAPQVLLINADAWLQPGALALLRRRLLADSRCAAVGPRLAYADGSFQRWTGGQFPTLASAACHLLQLERVGALGHRSLFLVQDIPVSFEPDWISSACMLVRSGALHEVGGMDESFFCYMDDVDLCQRLSDAGWTVRYEPAATVTHLMGQATRRQTGRASPMALANFNAYFLRRHGAARTALLRGMQLLGFALRVVAYGVQGLLPQNASARAQALAHLRNLHVASRASASVGPPHIPPLVAPQATRVPREIEPEVMS